MLLTYSKLYLEIDKNHVQDEIVNQINNLNTKYQCIIVDSIFDTC